MAYTKQNFEDGQTLKAEHLNKMEEGIAAPDWDQMVNRPFGETPTVLYEGTDLTPENKDGVYMAQLSDQCMLVTGTTCKVTFDGVEYTCMVVDYYDVPMMGNLSMMGAGDDTGEPFIVFDDSSDGGGVSIVASTAFTSLRIDAATITRIPAKYLDLDLETVFYVNGSTTEYPYIYKDFSMNTPVTLAELTEANNKGRIRLLNTYIYWTTPTVVTLLSDYGYVCWQMPAITNGTVTVTNHVSYTAEYTES